MGDPKKISNKYQKPAHPWNKARIEQEKPLMKKYGLEAKSELWKITSKLKTFKQNAKRLVAMKGSQAEKERTQIFDKLRSYGLVSSNNVDDILGLSPEQLLDRRLQTIVLKKGLARSIKQARQMITHRHVMVNGKKVTAPSYLVKVSEEHTVDFYPGSKFFREDHPERPVREEVPGKVHKEAKKPEEEESKPQKQRKPSARKPKEEKDSKSSEDSEGTEDSEKIEGEEQNE